MKWPTIKALYSASLFAREYSNLILNLILSSSSISITTPTPPDSWLDDPSSFGLGVSSQDTDAVNFVTKSDIACPLITVHDRYSMSNSLSSTNHSTHLHDASDFPKICHNG